MLQRLRVLRLSLEQGRADLLDDLEVRLRTALEASPVAFELFLEGRPIKPFR
jgi:hypothetical protein